MTESVIPRCELYREWSTAELKELFDQYESGMDIELLASLFSTAIKEIWHQLVHLYFAKCLTTSDSSAPNHGHYWTPTDDMELDRLYSRQIGTSEIAEALGRSEHGVCLRLVLGRRAILAPGRIRALGLDPEDY